MKPFVAPRFRCGTPSDYGSRETKTEPSKAIHWRRRWERADGAGQCIRQRSEEGYSVLVDGLLDGQVFEGSKFFAVRPDGTFILGDAKSIDTAKGRCVRDSGDNRRWLRNWAKQPVEGGET